MNELSERQKLILTLLIHEHIRTAAPVGSQNLVGQYKLDMSSATVRNEMSALTEMGYLRQPYTSAGRVPTEEGYRYFVGRLVQQTELPDSTRHMITHQFYQTRQDMDQWMPLAASVLAHQSSAASLITAPHPARAHLRHVELISTRGRQVLMVLVMVGGEIHQRLLTLENPISQEQLSAIAEHLNLALQGKDVETVRAIHPQFSGQEQQIVSWMLDEMEQADATAAGDVYLDGLTNVLAAPEFAASEEARRALRVLEERPLLQDLISRTLLNGSIGGVQVLIGGEGAWDELRQCSVILARYGTPGLATGTLGVLGPMRMAYGRTISTVRFLSSLLSNLVTETMVE
jgi:heat-inducible transcriptional repressor